jgi:hypothetical protein
MLTRRIAASACALALIVPAAAQAVPATDPPAGTQPSAVTYGDTKYDLQNAQDLSGPVGDTKNDITPVTPAPAPAPAPVASNNDNTNGWQIAAWAEAAVLAAAALGAAVLIGGRTRSRRLGT